MYRVICWDFSPRPVINYGEGGTLQNGWGGGQVLPLQKEGGGP